MTSLIVDNVKYSYLSFASLLQKCAINIMKVKGFNLTFNINNTSYYSSIDLYLE